MCMGKENKNKKIQKKEERKNKVKENKKKKSKKVTENDNLIQNQEGKKIAKWQKWKK